MIITIMIKILWAENNYDYDYYSDYDEVGSGGTAGCKDLK